MELKLPILHIVGGGNLNSGVKFFLEVKPLKVKLSWEDFIGASE